MNVITGIRRRLGGASMYRVVTGALAALVVVAFVQSLLGALAFSPAELASSLAVALGSTVLVSVLVARAFRTRAHVESSVITGFIVFFLIWPSTAPADLAGVAAAGALGALGKFALAWRGRHIFNPAALGAFVVSVAGIGVTAWWVGSAALAPFVLVLGAIVVVRAGVVGPALVFVAISGIPKLVDAATTGTDGGVLAIVQEGLGSSHVLFLAAFMLTEPLTGGVGRWQRLLVAAVVGVLDVVPLSLGTFTGSPEFALLCGNLLAFVLARPHRLDLEVLAVRDVAPEIVELTFRTQRPARFRPGQFLELDLPHRRADARGTRRPLSIVASREDVAADRLRVATRVPGGRSSSFKRAAAALRPGDTAAATGIDGSFVLPRNRRTPLLLVAAGVGVTPLVSQLLLDGEGRDAVVVLVAPSAAEAPYLDDLVSAGARVLVVERRAAASPGAAASGRWETVAFTSDALSAAVGDLSARTAYLSGSPAFVRDAKRLVRAARVRRVRTDAFAGV